MCYQQQPLCYKTAWRFVWQAVRLSGSTDVLLASRNAERTLRLSMFWWQQVLEKRILDHDAALSAMQRCRTPNVCI